MISAWYQFLHVTQPEMSIYNSELVLLSDVVDELIQDCFIFTFAFLVFSLFVAFLLLCIIVFSTVGE